MRRFYDDNFFFLFQNLVAKVPKNSTSWKFNVWSELEKTSYNNSYVFAAVAVALRLPYYFWEARQTKFWTKFVMKRNF